MDEEEDVEGDDCSVVLKLKMRIHDDPFDSHILSRGDNPSAPGVHLRGQGGPQMLFFVTTEL